MQTVTIQIKNKKALKILQDLEEVDLIKLLSIFNHSTATKELKAFKNRQDSKKNTSILSLAGIWKGRDLTIEHLRSKAWPKRK